MREHMIVSLADPHTSQVQAEELKQRLIERFPGVDITVLTGVSGVAVVHTEGDQDEAIDSWGLPPNAHRGHLGAQD